MSTNPTRPFERIAIVNRGEPAMRLIRTVRELARASGPAYRTVALYTDPDQQSLFVREADEALRLGPATFVDPSGQRQSGYLDYGRLEAALVESRADAAWVGWGFVSEQARFAELCERLGVVFIGPPASAIRELGDKISANRLATATGVPLRAWSCGPVTTLDEAVLHARRIGFPLMVKASAGGGGRGVRLVNGEDGLEAALQSARTEAANAFGDPSVFLEEYVPRARHVEVQVVCDSAGTGWALGVRDCSVQRRFQKVIEESASTALSPEQEGYLRSAAVRMCLAAGYRGAGTVEFLLNPASGALSFLEVNARLQVEHTVTEATTRADVVKLQLHIASGGRLEGHPPAGAGHAIEARLYAEDPDRGFAPSAGVVDRLRLPGGAGIRVDCGVAEGDLIPAEFDPMIAKIVAWGENRAEALGRLISALEDTRVVIRDGVTNRALLLRLLKHSDLRRGDLDINWMERACLEVDGDDNRCARVALLAAAVEAYGKDVLIDQAHFYASAARGRPEVGKGVGKTIELHHRGLSYVFTVCRIGRHVYRVVGEGGQAEIQLQRMGRFERRALLAGSWHRVEVVDQSTGYLVEVDGTSHRVSRAGGANVRAPSPAIVLSILVQPGQPVSAGTAVAVLEAMKTMTQVLAPVDGTVSEVFTGVNVQVDANTPLMHIEPLHEPEAAAGRRVVFEPPPVLDKVDRYLRNLTFVRRVVMGFDADEGVLAQFLAAQDSASTPAASGHRHEIRGLEDEILDIFTDVCSLSQHKREITDESGEEAHGQQEHLYAYLRSIDGEGRGLPSGFIGNLRRALTHYGVHSLARTPELEESVYSIFRSQRTLPQQIPAIMAILERRIETEVPGDQNSDGRLAALLDRVIAATQGRFPAVADVARELQYRRFHLPLYEAARARVYSDMDVHLRYLAENPSAPDRAVRMVQLVECPQPMQNLLTRRATEVAIDVQRLMLEVLTRRYYRSRTLLNFKSFVADATLFAEASFSEPGGRIHLKSAFGLRATLDEITAALKPAFDDKPAQDQAAVDLYLWTDGGPEDADTEGRSIAEILNRTCFPQSVARVLVAVSGPGRGLGMDSTQHFTYLRGSSGYEEDRLHRGLHPMMVERLQMWRLKNFRTERLPSVEDVYLLRGVAYENAKDERLFAIAEVRDLTPVHDDSGRIVQLPYLERMYMEALAAIRRQQSHRPASAQLQGNRVMLHIWPPLDVRPDELHAIVNRLAAASEGLGMEKTVVQVRMRDRDTGQLKDTVLHFGMTAGAGVTVLRFETPTDRPIQPLSDYLQKVVQLRRRGLVYPYELLATLAPAGDAAGSLPRGDFVEHDLAGGKLVAVKRPPGANTSNLVLGVVRNFTWKYPEGMERVIVLGDPSRSLGALAEPECRRVIAALDLAQEKGVPLEWFAVSSGARISMDSGTENMDWIAAVLRRLIEFTQSGGEVNLVVNGINVGAQPYWNAEATMLMHTRGILVMTPEGAMVLTGKQALDYSGGVSADDNYGIGGYERIMGPNGQSQYWAPDLTTACKVLLNHYEHTYRAPSERFPRRAATVDPRDRDVRDFPHPAGLGSDFTSVGDIFSSERNPERKTAFDMRTLMAATIDRDLAPLERWLGMRDAETTVVWDAHLGGYPVCLIGIESKPLIRRGPVPADGPQQWTPGTLFPLSSKKVARAINSASDNRPVVVLANLSGFDGSPESMRSLQLEYGAEIGRAVVNFKGPLVFCVVSRYHGGAFVVFSTKLNEGLEIAAVEGSYASVIGGAPAAGVVFAGEVESRTRADARVAELDHAIATADAGEKAALRNRMATLLPDVRAEKLGEVAAEFDSVHNVQRAQQVGSIHRIIAASQLRPYLIEAVERGMRRELERARIPERMAEPVG